MNYFDFVRENSALEIKNKLENGKIELYGEEDTLLNASVLSGEDDKIDVVMSFEPDLFKEDKYGRDTLYWAAHKNNIDFIKMLKEKGMDIFREYKNERPTALSNAHSIKTIEYFLDNGASEEYVKKSAEGVLTTAAYYMDIEMFDFIMDRFKIKLNEAYPKYLSYVKTYHDIYKDQRDFKSKMHMYMISLFEDDEKVKNKSFDIYEKSEEHFKSSVEYLRHVENFIIEKESN